MPTGPQGGSPPDGRQTAGSAWTRLGFVLMLTIAIVVSGLAVAQGAMAQAPAAPGQAVSSEAAPAGLGVEPGVWTDASSASTQNPTVVGSPQHQPAGGKTCETRLDLMLLIDGSLSIPPPVFQDIALFADVIVGGLTLSPNAAQVGLIQFSGRDQLVFHSGLTPSAGRALAAIDAMRRSQIQGETYFAQAIRRAIGELTGPSGRPGAQRAILLFTDGVQTEDPEDLAGALAEARAAGVFIVAVGVGPEVDPAQVAQIAGVPGIEGLAVTRPTIPDIIEFVSLAEELLVGFCPTPEDHARIFDPAPGSVLPCGTVRFRLSLPPSRQVLRYIIRIYQPNVGELELSFGTLLLEDVSPPASELGSEATYTWSNPPQDGRPLIVVIETVYPQVSQVFSYAYSACTPPCACPSPTPTPMTPQRLDLAVTLSASPNPGTSGNPFRLTAVVQNVGSVTATNATLVISLDGAPAGVDFTSVRLNNTTPGGCTRSAREFRCTGGGLENVPVGATRTFVVEITPRDILTTLNFGARISAAGDVNPANDTSATSVMIRSR